MHLQENTNDLTPDLWIKVTQNIVQYPLHHVTYATAKLLHPLILEVIHLQDNIFLWPGVKVTWNIAQYPLHHKTYAQAKFGVSMSSGLEENTITRNMVDGWMTDRLWYKINIPFFKRKIWVEQNVWLVLNPNCLTLLVFLKIFEQLI